MAKKKNEFDDWDDNDNLDNQYGEGKFSKQDTMLDSFESEEDDQQDQGLDQEEEEEFEIRPKQEKKAKSKLINKHSLAKDTIFNNVKKNQEELSEYDHYINIGGSMDLGGGLEYEESRNNIDYHRDTELKKGIRDLLDKNTDINFNLPRRKPAKTDFNSYMSLLVKQLHTNGYTKTEIFIELSFYFSDNTWNMFQLLDTNWANLIIQELREKRDLKGINKIDFL